MKKIIFAVMVFFTICSVSSVSAEGITKEKFSEGLAAIICGVNNDDRFEIIGIENPSAPITEFEAIEALVTAWEIRLGKLEPAALGGHLEGYANLSKEEKKIIDKTVMIGIVPESGRISKDRLIEKDTVMVYLNQVEKSIEIMRSHGVPEIITTFRNENGITGVPDGKITFYATLNEKPEYNNASLVMALYCDDRLIDVVNKSYTDLADTEFMVMHTSIEVPESESDMKVKAFIFDSLNGMKPIYEYKLLR